MLSVPAQDIIDEGEQKLLDSDLESLLWSFT